MSAPLQKSCSTTSPAVWSKSTPSSRYKHTHTSARLYICVRYKNGEKNSIKPEEDLSVIRHTCRQLCRRRDSDQMSAAADCLPQASGGGGGDTDAERLIRRDGADSRDSPASEICVRAATRWGQFNDLTSSPRRAKRFVCMRASKQAGRRAGSRISFCKKKRGQTDKQCLRRTARRTSLMTSWFKNSKRGSI